MGFIDFRENNIYTVYVHIVPKSITNYNFDKYYVGITSLSVKKRWGRLGINYQNITFGKAIKKYGWNNIEHEIIAEHLTETEASEMEIKLIEKLSSTANKFGYNVRLGGNVTRGFKVSEETKQKISKANTGKKRTQEMRETIRKNTPIKRYENNVNIKRIYRFSEDGIFLDSFSCAQKICNDLGVRREGVLKCARKSGSLYNGFQWEFEKNIINENGIIKPKNKVLDTYIYKFTKNGEYIERYKSIVEASNVNKMSESYLGQMILKNKIYKGYIFCRKDNILQKDGKTYLKTIPSVKKIGKEVYQFTTDGVFVKKYINSKFAKKEIGLKSDVINVVAKGNVKYVKTAGGYLWRYKKDVINIGNSYIIRDEKKG